MLLSCLVSTEVHSHTHIITRIYLAFFSSPQWTKCSDFFFGLSHASDEIVCVLVRQVKRLSINCRPRIIDWRKSERRTGELKMKLNFNSWLGPAQVCNKKLHRKRGAKTQTEQTLSVIHLTSNKLEGLRRITTTNWYEILKINKNDGRHSTITIWCDERTNADSRRRYALQVVFHSSFYYFWQHQFEMVLSWNECCSVAVSSPSI